VLSSKFKFVVTEASTGPTGRKRFTGREIIMMMIFGVFNWKTKGVCSATSNDGNPLKTGAGAVS
jgi:hypothetical protein